MTSPSEQEYPHPVPSEPWEDDDAVLLLRNRQACQDRLATRLLRLDRNASWRRSGGRKPFSVRDRAPRDVEDQMEA